LQVSPARLPIDMHINRNLPTMGNICYALLSVKELALARMPNNEFEDARTLDRTGRRAIIKMLTHGKLCRNWQESYLVEQVPFARPVRDFTWFRYVGKA